MLAPEDNQSNASALETTARIQASNQPCDASVWNPFRFPNASFGGVLLTVEEIKEKKEKEKKKKEEKRETVADIGTDTVCC